MPGVTTARSKLPPRNDDMAWKIVLPPLLPDFLAFINPTLAEAIDWLRTPVPMDKELRAITRKGRRGRRDVDLLLKVWLKNGQEQWLLIHIEVQGQKKEDFPRRLFLYHVRLLDYYGNPVVSLAILSDGDAAWHPTEYRHNHGGCQVVFSFPTLKLLDWRGRESELATSPNPFAQVALAYLTVLIAKGDVPSLAAAWRAIVWRLREAGYSEEKTGAVLTFLEWTIHLPAEVEEALDAELAELEGRAMVQIMPRWERRGWEKGMLEGQRAIVLRLLERKCGPLDALLRGRLEELGEHELEALSDALLDFTTRADLERWLAERPAQ